jgi:glycosyltransferase involved in cell wall biosynthesis
LKNKPQIFIDLLPLRADGSNGGNLLFIINLIKYLAVSIENPLIIICSPKKKTFLKKSLSFDNPNSGLKKIKIIHSYQDALNYYSFDGQKKVFPIRIKNFINNIIERLLIRILSKLNVIEIMVSRVNETLKKNSHSIFKTLAFRIIFRVIVKIKKLVSQFQSKKNFLIGTKIKKILFSPFGNFSFQAYKFDRVISIIYDMQHKDLPFMFSAEEIEARNFNYPNICNISYRVITISNFTKQKILHYIGINDESIKVIHLPPQFTKNNDNHILKAPLAVLQLNKVIKKNKFFFIPGNFWSHKNQKTLLVAINMFLRINPDIFFIFSGKFMTSLEKNEFDDFLRFNNLRKKVWLLGYIDSYSINFLYSQCLAVISASLYEGFGMVLKEANAFRKVIICSDIPAHREVSDTGASIFFDPRNPKDILEKLILFVRSNEKNYTFSKTINAKEVYQDYLNVIVGEA